MWRGFEALLAGCVTTILAAAAVSGTAEPEGRTLK
jgi:hypothetical protein